MERRIVPVSYEGKRSELCLLGENVWLKFISYVICLIVMCIIISLNLNFSVGIVELSVRDV